MAEPGEKQAVKRVTCHDGQAVYEVIKHFISKPGDLFYRENVTEGPQDIAQIEKHQRMLLDLRAGPCPNGSLTKNAAEYAAKLLAGNNEDTWHLGREQFEFIAKFGKRLRAIQRDVQQGVYKAKGRTAAPWVLPFLPSAEAQEDKEEQGSEQLEQTDAMAPEAGETEQSAAASSNPKAGKQWCFGWDDEMEMAYRSTTPKGKREYCLKKVRPIGASDSADAVAVWSDGCKWNIPTLTCGELDQKLARPKKGAIWSGRHHADTSEVLVKPCSSKGKTWLILWHADAAQKLRQIMQLVTTNFSEVKLKEAEDFMKKAATDFAEGKIDKHQLELRKKEFASKAKVTARPPTPVMKRPASSSTATSTPQPGKKPRREKEAAKEEEEEEEVGEEGEEEEEEVEEEDEEGEKEEEEMGEEETPDTACQDMQHDEDDLPPEFGMFEFDSDT